MNKFILKNFIKEGIYISNTLIVYYSHSGNTRKMAKIIAEQLHADCLEIIPQKPYPQAYNAVV
ncbi:flavodoxin, partial [Megamonas funiformis]